MHKKQAAAPKCNHGVRLTLSPQILTPFFVNYFNVKYRSS